VSVQLSYKTVNKDGGYAPFFVTKAEVSKNGRKGIDKRSKV
jgi:hypothetical protein